MNRNIGMYGHPVRANDHSKLWIQRRGQFRKLEEGLTPAAGRIENLERKVDDTVGAMRKSIASIIRGFDETEQRLERMSDATGE